MKKLLVIVCLCTAVSVSCSSSKVSLLGRLGFFRIFRQAQRAATVITHTQHAETSKLPVYTPHKTPAHELFPIQPSSDSAAVRKELALFTARLTAPIRDFFKPHQYRNAQIEGDLTRINALLGAASTGEREARNLATPPVARAA